MLQNLTTFVISQKLQLSLTLSLRLYVHVSIVLDEVTEQNIVTQIVDITEEILTPVKFLDEEIKDDCVTAALLGLDCLKEFQGTEQILVNQMDEVKAIETGTSVATEQVTELVTEILEPVMEMVTQIDDSTEEILTQCGKLGGAAVLQVRELE